MDFLEPFAGVETGTGLADAGEVAVTEDLGIGEVDAEAAEQFFHGDLLSFGAGVGRTTIGIQTTLVTDADGAAVVRSGMRPHLQETTMLRHRSVTADIEVIANGTEATSLVVAHHLLHGITSITPRGRTMEHEEANGEWRLHPLAVFHASKEGTLAACYLLAYR